MSGSGMMQNITEWNDKDTSEWNDAGSGMMQDTRE